MKRTVKIFVAGVLSGIILTLVVVRINDLIKVQENSDLNENWSQNDFQIEDDFDNQLPESSQSSVQSESGSF